MTHLSEIVGDEVLLVTALAPNHDDALHERHAVDLQRESVQIAKEGGSCAQKGSIQSAIIICTTQKQTKKKRRVTTRTASYCSTYWYAPPNADAGRRVAVGLSVLPETNIPL